MAVDVDRRKVLQAGLTAGACLATVRLAYARPPATVSGNRPEAATQHFLKSMNCSQAILETYSPVLGLNAETTRRLATGFAGGQGMGHKCGAVTGVYLALGLARSQRKGGVCQDGGIQPGVLHPSSGTGLLPAIWHMPERSNVLRNNCG